MVGQGRDGGETVGQGRVGGETVWQRRDGGETVGQGDGGETVWQRRDGGEMVGQGRDGGEMVGQGREGGETVGQGGETVEQGRDGGETVGQGRDGGDRGYVERSKKGRARWRWREQRASERLPALPSRWLVLGSFQNQEMWFQNLTGFPAPVGRMAPAQEVKGQSLSMSHDQIVDFV